MTDFGIWLTDCRRKARLTQLDLSRITGLSIVTISSLENGKKNPSLPTIRLMCEVFNRSFKITKDSVFR